MFRGGLFFVGHRLRRGVRLPIGSPAAIGRLGSLFLVLGVLRRRWLASRGGTNLHLAALFALGARERFFFKTLRSPQKAGFREDNRFCNTRASRVVRSLVLCATEERTSRADVLSAPDPRAESEGQLQTRPRALKILHNETPVPLFARSRLSEFKTRENARLHAT